MGTGKSAMTAMYLGQSIMNNPEKSFMIATKGGVYTFTSKKAEQTKGDDLKFIEDDWVYRKFVGEDQKWEWIKPEERQ